MKLALGTVQFGLQYGIANSEGQVPLEEARSILRLAHDLHVDTLDTAIAYGESEANLGKIGVQGWNVVTKLPTIPEHIKDVKTWVREQTEQSLRRLNVAKVHGLLLHQPAQLFQKNGLFLYQELLELRAKGVVNKIGVSIYDPAELDRLFADFSFDLVQAPLNILDQRLIKSGWLNRLLSLDVEVHTRSVFLQGLLLMPTSRWPKKFSPWSSISLQWRRWLDETGIHPLQACLGFALAQAAIHRIVVGVDSSDQLLEIVRNMRMLKLALPEFEPISDTRIINPATWGKL